MCKTYLHQRTDSKFTKKSTQSWATLLCRGPDSFILQNTKRHFHLCWEKLLKAQWPSRLWRATYCLCLHWQVLRPCRMGFGELVLRTWHLHYIHLVIFSLWTSSTLVPQTENPFVSEVYIAHLPVQLLHHELQDCSTVWAKAHQRWQSGDSFKSPLQIHTKPAMRAFPMESKDTSATCLSMVTV